MPPSGHSSSSHSSHSSHSSSRSYHSSSHSYSSHSGSSVSRRPSVYTGKKRYNQPHGYSGTHQPVKRYCKHHEYHYYPTGWSYNDVYYNPGYYDERGNYYENVIFQEKGNSTVELTCEYCGTHSKITWKTGAIPNCPNCGAVMKIDDIYTDQVLTPAEINMKASEQEDKKACLGCSIVFAVIGAFIGLAAVSSTDEFVEAYDNFYSDTNYSSGSSLGDVVYLAESEPGVYVVTNESDADKTMKWDSSYDSYYEPVSDCYLWYNENVTPGIWQYWYEGYSSDYGDYGWMEFETDTWYVEASEDNWIEYPGDTSTFWHIENAFDNLGEGSDIDGTPNPYIFGTTLYVKEEVRNGEKVYVLTDDTVKGKGLAWNTTAEAYYDPDLECYFWYNNYGTPYVWQCYSSSISTNYDGGWMEFYEGEWWINDGEDWIVYDGDTSGIRRIVE